MSKKKLTKQALIKLCKDYIQECEETLRSYYEEDSDFCDPEVDSTYLDMAQGARDIIERVEKQFND